MKTTAGRKYCPNPAKNSGPAVEMPHKPKKQIHLVTGFCFPYRTGALGGNARRYLQLENL
jgi:hypothetical protein